MFANLPGRKALFAVRLYVVKLHELILSLTISSAIGTALLVLISRSLKSWTPASDLSYDFFRSAIKINDLLHVTTRNPNFGDLPNSGGRVGSEVAFCLPLVAFTLFLLILWRSIGRLRAAETVLDPITGVLTFFVFPACYFLALSRTWNLGPGRESEPLIGSTPWIVFIAGASGVGILLAIDRLWTLSPWVFVTLMVPHYCFWIVVLSQEIPPYSENMPFVFPTLPRLLLAGMPLSGISWLLYRSGLRNGVPDTSGLFHSQKWLSASLAVVVLVCLYVVFPGKGLSLVNARDKESLKIEMTRGRCYGPCPVYKVTINGRGLAEYIGNQNVKELGHRSVSLNHKQLESLLQEFDNIGFFTLEDRAFVWCYDTPRVTVTIVVDGKTKQVSSDAGCAGAKTGLQFQFVKTAAKIDELVGTAPWIR